MFIISNTDDSARAGVITTPHGAISTPALLLPTRRGSPLNMTPDVLAGLQPQAQAVQLDALQFLKSPDALVLQQFPGSARDFLALNDGLVMVATARDPCLYEYAGTQKQSTDAAAAVSIHTGGHSVTPAQYMDVMTALQPDLLVVLSDDVPADAKRERAAVSVNRTLAWLRECLEVRSQTPALQQSALLAAVQGGQHMAERERCAQAVAAIPGPVAGFAIGGLGTGESPAQQQEVLAAVIKHLPADKLRLASGLGTPEEVLAAVAQGIDLFDMGYLTEVTAGGYALCFPYQHSSSSSNDSRSSCGTGTLNGRSTNSSSSSAAAAEAEAQDASKLCLWGLAFRADKRPLLPGCSCFTCRTHSRAYVHHLLHTHEMTAQVLLDVHNTHHYLAFFSAIRDSIEAGAFRQYHQHFLERRQRLLQAH